MNKIILRITVIIYSLTLYGCGTIKGIGNDITFIGEAISNSSDHVRESVANNPPGSKMGSKSK